MLHYIYIGVPVITSTYVGTKLELNTQALACKYHNSIPLLSSPSQPLLHLRHSTFTQKASRNIASQPLRPPHLSDNPPHHSKNRPHLRPLSHRPITQAKLTTVCACFRNTHTRAHAGPPQAEMSLEQAPPSITALLPDWRYR